MKIEIKKAHAGIVGCESSEEFDIEIAGHRKLAHQMVDEFAKDYIFDCFENWEGEFAAKEKEVDNLHQAISNALAGSYILSGGDYYLTLEI